MVRCFFGWASDDLDVPGGYVWKLAKTKEKKKKKRALTGWNRDTPGLRLVFFNSKFER